MSARQRKKRRGRRNARGPLGLALVVLVTAAVAAGLAAVGWVVAIAATAPPLGKPIDKGASSAVYASDGRLLGYIQSDEIRTPVAWQKIPKNLSNATVAIEDERFYKHKGVDYSAIVRAAVKNLKSGKTVQGGSTITQQLVRNLYIADPKRDYKRKIREAKLASELEQDHKKRWILQQYLNTVPYGTVGGQSAIGVQAAAQTFFAKNASQLNLPESALLAGLPQAPTDYNPFINPSGALERRNEVLNKMAELGYVTQAEAEAAIETRLKVTHGRRYTTVREPFFFDYVKQKLIDRYGINVVRRGGLKVHTTIDPKLQIEARSAITSLINQPSFPSSAIVSIDPKTGYIKAMASSQKFGNSQFNLAAQGKRQPGSAFKTMVLTTALLRGIDPQRTTYVSKPIDIKDPKYGPIKVKTAGGEYYGTQNLVSSTLHSDNSVYIQLDLDVGPKNVAKTARLLGITSHLDGYPAEGLGGLDRGVSPLEMANAYATLAAGGIRSRAEAIQRVEFPGGKTIKVSKPKRERVIPDGVAYEVTKILKQNIIAGTGRNAQTGCPAAGKTGTTDNDKDAWFVGYTPVMATASWVGYPSAAISMSYVPGLGRVQGPTTPAQIWGRYMTKAKGKYCKDFPKPKTPFKSKPFFGHYASTGKAYVPAPGATDETGKKDKKKKKDSKDKGKEKPTKPEAPAPTPPPADTDTGAIEPG